MFEKFEQGLKGGGTRGTEKNSGMEEVPWFEQIAECSHRRVKKIHTLDLKV